MKANATHVFRIRTYAASPWADVWLIRREGIQDESLMHGRVMPDKLSGLLDLLDRLEGVVEIEREKSPWDGPADAEAAA